MVEGNQPKQVDTYFPHVYEPPRPIEKHEEREMAQKMIKAIDLMNAPKKHKDKMKVLYVQSDELAWMGEHFNMENDEVEARFKEKRAKILQVRDQIVKGDLVNFAGLIPFYDKRVQELETFAASNKTKKSAAAEKEDEDHEPKDLSHLVGKPGVADFWADIILKHPSIEQYIEEKDRAILKHVKSVYVEQIEKPSVVTVKMEFHENEFFSNQLLEYVLRFEDSEEEQIEAVCGTVINWYKKKDVTRKRVRKMQRHRETGVCRTVYAFKETPSFFNIFKSREAADCTNATCKVHKGPEHDELKAKFAKMSKYRQDKILKEQEQTTDDLSTANNVALLLFDAYSKDALENYLGFWRAYPEDEGEEGEDWQDESSEGNSDNGGVANGKKKAVKNKNLSSSENDNQSDSGSGSSSSQSDEWGDDDDGEEEDEDPDYNKKMAFLKKLQESGQNEQQAYMSKLSKQEKKLIADLGQKITKQQQKEDSNAKSSKGQKQKGNQECKQQ